MRMTITKLLFLSLIVLCFGCKHAEFSADIDVEELTISQIHEAYQNGDYTCVQLTRAYLQRIGEYDGPIKPLPNQDPMVLNAITVINPNVLEQAEALDAEYKRTGVLRPLHGIPILIKDNINTKGMQTAAGSRALADYLPETDAFVLEKLIEAGALVIAKTNMAEWAFSAMHSESTTFGTTRNPYNTKHVPAGSSGGTGAGVAANFATVGLGTDTGNSIRGPSSHCSLVGFRTTLGLISRSGIVPLYLRNDVVGPMCRTVEDATRVMEVMVGIDPLDPITDYSAGRTYDNYTQFLQKDGLQNARIGVLRELSEDEVDPEIKKLFEQAVTDLQRLGATVVDPMVVPGFAELRKNQWCATFRSDLEEFLATHVKRDSLQTLEDIVEVGTNSEFAKMRLETFSDKNDRWGPEGIPCQDAYTDSLRIAYRGAIERVMDSLELDAVVYPTWNDKPARIDRFEEEYKGDNNQVIAPHTGQPAFTVPMGFASGNLPAGLQFLGRMYDEPVLIRLAYAYEQGTLHRKPPMLGHDQK